MARLIQSPTGSGPQGPFEQKVVEHLRGALPDDYKLLPNFSVKETGQQPLEYDLVVVAPHAIYVVESKEWYGRITGDDTEWLLNSAPRKCPMWLLDLKCKVLKRHLGAVGHHVWVEPLLVVPDNTLVRLDGAWSRSVLELRELGHHLSDPKRVRHAGNISSLHESVVKTLQGRWGARRRDERRRVAGFEVIETISAGADSGEYIAKRALVEDPARFRIRTWQVDPYLSPSDRERRLNVVRRPTEALVRIGRQPNLLTVLAFDELPDEHEFYEVTEWSEFGTLHGYLRNVERGEPLTLRERLDIASGVASALEAVHAHQVVHRNVCPEAILIGFDRQPRLTNFDRAYIESGQTVFASTEGSPNRAYLPPELENKTDYDFDTCSDMYSFGVLLYELVAGEVPFADPQQARQQQGVPSRPASAFRDGIDPALDELVVQLLNVEDFRERPTATDVLNRLRAVLGGSSQRQRPKSATPTPPAQPTFERGTIVDALFRVDDVLGSGGFTRVFKVYHLDHCVTYAMKVLTKVDDADVILDEYAKVGRHLPPHPNIARMYWMARLAPPASTPYILSEFIEGETLEAYADGRKRLPWTDIRAIGTQLLDALDAFHPKTTALDSFRSAHAGQALDADSQAELERLERESQEGILHRDIKPANIILELPSHRPKLIDFNIASQLVHARGRPGTPRYWAPDRGQPEWRPDCDLFSLGVVLYELVTHAHPFPNNRPEDGSPIDPRETRPDLNVGAELSAFLLKAVDPKGPRRFQTAAEMREALQRVPSMYGPPRLVGPPGKRLEGLTLDADERCKQNNNPYVTRLLTLYSQARRSNAGTRGLDEIARLTYVQTRLDLKLAPAIADGRFRLVIVTGNAGDGKTAFLQQVEEQFRQIGAHVTPMPSRNGSRWSHHGLDYETNYDGSQDEGDVTNDDVLDRFLAPFRGSMARACSAREVRIIAVNEGRLLDFLDHASRRVEYEELRRFVHASLGGDERSLERALLVNLNLRAVAAHGKESLVERQIEKLVAAQLWAPCEDCELKRRCPLKHNADTLRDAASGPAVRDRLRRLFEIIQLRRRAHVTMRDLRSALSWLLLRDHGCEDVAALLEHAQPESLLRLYYPDAYSNDSPAAAGRLEDRLVQLLRETDVGAVNAPGLDQRLNHDADTAVPWMTFEDRSGHGHEVLAAWTRSVPASTADASLEDLLSRRRALISRWRRWAYFERRDDGWRSMLPYRSLGLHERLVGIEPPNSAGSAAAELKDRAIEAVSLSEGLRNPDLRRRYLGLRASRVKNATIRSYRLFPKEEFKIDLAAPPALTEFLEYAPDVIELVDLGGKARLRLTLDLLEMLELIRCGYRPSPSDLQGLFVNLSIFRNELLNLPFHRVVLTEDDESLYELAAATDAEDGILLTLTESAGERPAEETTE